MPYIFVATRPLPLPEWPWKRGTGDLGQQKGRAGMWRIFKALLVLAAVGLAALTGYAYLADLSPPQEEVTRPVMLNAR